MGFFSKKVGPGTPTYSPDVALYDFFLSPTMKNHLKGSHFEIMEEIQNFMTALLHNLQKNYLWECSDCWKQC
jgi:hypothetical protein